jgi:hypothetical protein
MLVFTVGIQPAMVPATCGPCSCSNCTGGTCTATMEKYANSLTCQNDTPSLQEIFQSCTVVTSRAKSFVVDVSTDTATVSCDTTSGSVAKDPPMWQDRGRLCGASSLVGACENAGVCVPSLGEPERICIAKLGENSCPGSYPLRQRLYTDFEDTRNCACDCAPTVTCYAYFYSSANDCSDNYFGVAAGECVAPNVAAWSISGGRPTAKAHPTAMPVGALTPRTPLTVCCLQ